MSVWIKRVYGWLLKRNKNCRGRPPAGRPRSSDPRAGQTIQRRSHPAEGSAWRSDTQAGETVWSRSRSAEGTAWRGDTQAGESLQRRSRPVEGSAWRSGTWAGETVRRCNYLAEGTARCSGTLRTVKIMGRRVGIAVGAVGRGSFTVEAALAVPIFLLALLVILGFFPLLLIQTQVNAALQYTARIMAVSYQDEEDEGSIVSLAEGILLFRSYLGDHGLSEDFLENGVNSISLANTDLSGEYVQLVANYEVELPTGFWGIDSLPVEQCVSAKKWTGAGTDSSDEEEDTEYVYITPSGSVYHTTTSCPYLSLSTKSVSYSSLSSLRNSEGHIYYACSCYSGESIVYVTNYGTLYHGSLSCSYLKRTIYKVKLDAVGGRSACSKCGGG